MNVGSAMNRTKVGFKCSLSDMNTLDIDHSKKVKFKNKNCAHGANKRKPSNARRDVSKGAVKRIPHQSIKIPMLGSDSDESSLPNVNHTTSSKNKSNVTQSKNYVKYSKNDPVEYSESDSVEFEENDSVFNIEKIPYSCNTIASYKNSKEYNIDSHIQEIILHSLHKPPVSIWERENCYYDNFYEEPTSRLVQISLLQCGNHLCAKSIEPFIQCSDLYDVEPFALKADKFHASNPCNEEEVKLKDDKENSKTTDKDYSIINYKLNLTTNGKDNLIINDKQILITNDKENSIINDKQNLTTNKKDNSIINDKQHLTTNDKGSSTNNEKRHLPSNEKVNSLINDKENSKTNDKDNSIINYKLNLTTNGEDNIIINDKQTLTTNDKDNSIINDKQNLRTNDKNLLTINDKQHSIINDIQNLTINDKDSSVTDSKQKSVLTDNENLQTNEEYENEMLSTLHKSLGAERLQKINSEIDKYIKYYSYSQNLKENVRNEPEAQAQWQNLLTEKNEIAKKQHDNIVLLNSGSALRHTTQEDYRNQQTLIQDTEFLNVVEMYKFKPHLEIKDIRLIFLMFGDEKYDVKWVDETSVLLIFTDIKDAKKAMSMFKRNSMFKLRKLHRASHKAQVAAQKYFQEVEPDKPVAEK